MAVYDQSGCVMLRFENYCAQPVELGADGLPRHNTHGGYDLRGVQAAAQDHDGTMTLHWADGWFTLRILLPIPGIKKKPLRHCKAMPERVFSVLHNKAGPVFVDKHNKI